MEGSYTITLYRVFYRDCNMAQVHYQAAHKSSKTLFVKDIALKKYRENILGWSFDNIKGLNPGEYFRRKSGKGLEKIRFQHSV